MAEGTAQHGSRAPSSLTVSIPALRASWTSRRPTGGHQPLLVLQSREVALDTLRRARRLCPGPPHLCWGRAAPRGKGLHPHGHSGHACSQ